MAVSQGNLSAGDYVPHMGNEHGLKEDDSKEGALSEEVCTQFAIEGTQSPAIMKTVTVQNFMTLLTAEFCTYDYHSPLTGKRRISALAE